MLMHKCSFSGCTEILKDGEKYCKYHQAIVNKQNRQRYIEYSARRRQDVERKVFQDFYNSTAWIKLSKLVKEHFLNKCVICYLRNVRCNTDSLITHHIIELNEDPSKRLVKENLICLCPTCHQRVHAEYNKGIKDKKKMQDILYKLIEEFNSKIYF